MLETEHYVDLAAGRFASTSARDLDNIFAAYASGPRTTLLVHFHGGLNTRAEGIERVSRMAPTYLEAGAYPVFFVWQSWVSEVVQNGVTEIFGEKVYQAAVGRIVGFVVEKLKNAPTFRGGGPESQDAAATERDLRRLIENLSLPEGITPHRREQLFALTERERRSFRDSVQNDADLCAEIAAIANAQQTDAGPERRNRSGLPAQGSRQTRMNPQALAMLRGSEGTVRADFSLQFALALGKILARVCVRLANGHDHGLLATSVEEVLRELYFVEAWFSWMKAQIEDAFKPDPEQFGGTAFLMRLLALRQAGHRPRVILVGHSAGSIYICNFLDHAKRLVPGQQFDVVFLTPAVTFERFSATLQTSGDIVDNLKILSLGDAWEREDRWLPCVPEAYPASLLYFTSGVMEPDASGNGDVPIVGMQRFYSAAALPDQRLSARVREFFAAEPRRLTWLPPLPPEAGMTAVPVCRHHSGFDEDAGTRMMLQSIIKDGFR